MLTVNQILQLLTESVHASDREFYTDEELNEFAIDLVCRKDVKMDTIAHLADFICEEFIRYQDDHGKPCRRCSICGELFHEGYCLSHGAAYYCGEDCLRHDFTVEEWKKECETDDQSYYSEWY